MIRQLYRPLYWLLPITVTLSLVACTPSGEDKGNQFKLVIAAQVPQTLPTAANCAQTLPGTTKVPGLLVLSFAKINSVSINGGSGACTRERVVETPEIASDIASPSLSFERFFVALATTGEVRVYSSKFMQLGTLPLPMDYGAFCPTGLMLSPDEQRLAVVDDPADANAGCLTPNRAPRVLIYDISPSSIAAPLVWDTSEEKDKNLQRGRGAFAVALLNDNSMIKGYSLWRLGVENNRYTIARFNLPDLKPADSSARELLKTLNPALVPGSNDRAVLGITSSGADNLQLLGGLTSSGSFRGFTFLVPTSGDITELDNNSQKLGATQLVAFDTSANNKNTTAFAAQGRLLFRINEALREINGSGFKDLSWQESFLFALSETVVTRYDTDVSARSTQIVGLDIEKARAIAPVVDVTDTETPE
jgi:hypothetical protein